MFRLTPKRLTALFTTLLVLSFLFVASYGMFGTSRQAASAHVGTLAVVSAVNHQRHVVLVPHTWNCATATCTVSFTVHADGLPPGDIYILSTTGFLPPQCSANDSNGVNLKPDALGDTPDKLVTATGCKSGVLQVELLDADKQSEFWFALFTIRAV